MRRSCPGPRRTIRKSPDIGRGLPGPRGPKREYHGAGAGVQTLQHVREVSADRDLGDVLVEEQIDGSVSLPRQPGREIGCVLSSPLQLTEAALSRIVIDADHQGELLLRKKARGNFRWQQDAFAAVLRGGDVASPDENLHGQIGFAVLRPVNATLAK
jgi:hypothetical protein